MNDNNSPVIPRHGEVEGARIGVLARSSHGKSYLARYIVGYTLGNYSIPVIIIEPIAE